MYSLIDALSRLTRLPDETLGIELAQRDHRYPIPATAIADWRRHELPRPVWVQRAAARWIAELWRTARAGCSPPQCSAVDAHYATALDPALGEAYRLLAQINQKPDSMTPAAMRAELQPLIGLLWDRIARKFNVRVSTGDESWTLTE